jgi:long-chain acyl-CoA synthetase
MQKHKVTIFAGVPTMYFALLHFPKGNDFDVSSPAVLQLSGGSAMPVEVMSPSTRSST